MEKISVSRIKILTIFFVCCYCVISLRLFVVTIIPNLSFGNKHIHRVNTNSKRGDIVDRNGEILATGLVATSVYANPSAIIDMREAAAKLAIVFKDLKYTEVLRKLKSNQSFVWIKRNITPNEEQQVHNMAIPGVYFEDSQKRAYPHGSTAAHILGYVGVDGSGLAGVEHYFNKRLMQPDATPLKLSIDIKAQTLVREELSNAVREFNAKGAIGVLQHVNSGEIIAMVSLPDFDPHKPGQANPDALFNRATLGNYEIGSVFKAFTVAMALDSSTVNLNNVYDVSTPILISGAKIQDYQAKGGWMSVPQILMNSSNIGVSQMVMEMGKKAQFKYLKSFGLTSQLEIELNEKAAPYFRSEGKWSDLDSAIASYGYGIAASPLHLVKAMSAVVNGGKLYPPTLLAEQNHSPQQILKPSTSYNMNRLLRMVVRFGSGRKADVDGLFVAGKTGTANKLRNGKYDENLRISSFLSTFPAHKPEYVLLVTLDEPQPNKNTYGFATGGWVAAPATAKIIEKLSLALKIFPEYENKEAKERALFVEYNPKASASA